MRNKKRMDIISKIIEEIKMCKVRHNRRPKLILIGQREQSELYIQNQFKLPYRFMNIRILYTHEESEVRSLIY